VGYFWLVISIYRKRLKISQSIPGIGMISAMELLLELQDVSRFRRAEQLAA
jgi:transposase